MEKYQFKIKVLSIPMIPGLFFSPGNAGEKAK
jgi:hypothetical protein